MYISIKKILIIFLLISVNNISAQDTFILNYEDVDIKKVTQDIAPVSYTHLTLPTNREV